MAASHRFSNALRYRAEDHEAQCQITPSYVLEPVRASLSGIIGLDPCTTADNPCGAVEFYYPPQDGAELPWNALTIFCNPPYSKARERWVRRCIQAGAECRHVVLLVPASCDTRIVQDAMATSTAIVFVRGRIKFGVLRPNRRQAAASHPSALIGWNTDLAPCEHLGLRLAGGGAWVWPASGVLCGHCDGTGHCPLPRCSWCGQAGPCAACKATGRRWPA
jgi:DNA N-6-adenine-methyltransferase Dam